jgi:lysophospholipid acyltransferase (LPLAT)-like uncharacterized protein
MSSARARRLRFFLLERIVLPIAIVPFRLLMWSWRRRDPDPETLRMLLASPRAVLLTFHGMLLHLVAFAPLIDAAGRRLVVMLSPSRDGRLLAAFLAHFGIDHVRASTSSRGMRGSRELIRRVAAGDIGVIAVDGPRGPCCVTAPGSVRVAAAAEATAFLAVTSAERGIRFGSWDRAHLPGPFARVELRLVRAAELEHAQIDAALLASARDIDSPIVPEELRSAMP